MKQEDLDKAKSGEKDLRWADLGGEDLSGVHFLRWTNLRGADLSGANLSRTNLSGANLSGANLRRANLCGADLSGANLRWADLRWANLREADLSGADISGANGKISTFYGGKHHAWAVPGQIGIGCITESLEWWLENAERVGRENGYTEAEIGRYVAWLNTLGWLEESAE